MGTEGIVNGYKGDTVGTEGDTVGTKDILWVLKGYCGY